MIRRLVFVLTFLTAGLLRPARAEIHPVVPPGSLAWWSFDPGRFASARQEVPGRDLFTATIRAAVSSGILGDGTPSQVIEGLLAAADVGAVPHTVYLLDFAANRKPSGTGADIHVVQMVLCLHSGQFHDEYLRTLRAILIDAAKSKGQIAPEEGIQRTLSLPKSRTGVSYTDSSWPGWREVSWCSTPEAFYVALGHDALVKYFTLIDQTELDVDDLSSELWIKHIEQVESHRTGGDCFFQAYMNFDALRGTFPDAFHSGRTPRMLAALDLMSARDVMIQGRFINRVGSATPLIALDLTKTQSDPQGQRQLIHIPISSSEWPAGEIDLECPPGSYAIAAKVEWESFFRRAVDVYSATVQDTRLPEFLKKRNAWFDEYGDLAQALLSNAEPWVVLSDVPPPIVPAPGLCTVYLRAKQGTTCAGLVDLMQQTLKAFSERLEAHPSNVFALRVDDRGLVRLPVWTFFEHRSRPLLVGGWGFPIVEANRAWLTRAK